VVEVTHQVQASGVADRADFQPFGDDYREQRQFGTLLAFPPMHCVSSGNEQENK
jgi:hypothetical protein